MMPGTRNADDADVLPFMNANENSTRKNTGIASDQNIISPSRRKYQMKLAFVCARNIRSSVIPGLRSSRP